MKLYCRILDFADLFIQIGEPNKMDFIRFEMHKSFADHSLYQQVIKQTNSTTKTTLIIKGIPGESIVITYTMAADIKSAIKLILSPAIFPHLDWDQEDIYNDWEVDQTHFRTYLLNYASSKDMIFHEKALSAIREMLTFLKPYSKYNSESSVIFSLNKAIPILTRISAKELISYNDFLELYKELESNNILSRHRFGLFATEINIVPFALLQGCRAVLIPEKVTSTTDLPNEISEIVSSYAI